MIKSIRPMALALLLLLSTSFVGCASSPHDLSRDLASMHGTEIEDSEALVAPVAETPRAAPVIAGNSFLSAMRASGEIARLNSSKTMDPESVASLKDKASICKRLARGRWSPKKQRCTVGGEEARISLK